MTLKDIQNRGELDFSLQEGGDPVLLGRTGGREGKSRNNLFSNRKKSLTNFFGGWGGVWADIYVGTIALPPLLMAMTMFKNKSWYIGLFMSSTFTYCECNIVTMLWPFG